MESTMENLKFKEDVEHGTALFPMRCYEFEGEHQQCMVNLHWHDEMEWIYVTKGMLQIQMKDTIVEAHAGDIISIPMQEIHQLTSIGVTHYYAIVFSFDLLCFQNFDIVQSEYILPIMNREVLIDTMIHDHCSSSSIILNAIQAILDNDQRKKNAWQLAIKISLYQILCELYEQKKIALHKHLIEDEKSNVIKEVITYIKEHYKEKIYIVEIANCVHLNEQYLCRLFKSLTGKTLIEFMNEYRIEKACESLQTTNQSVMEISFLVGFENVSYFIYKFKKTKKKTPQQYRGQVRKKQGV